jgi:hypothetical protein
LVRGGGGGGVNERPFLGNHLLGAISEKEGFLIVWRAKRKDTERQLGKKEKERERKREEEEEERGKEDDRGEIVRGERYKKCVNPTVSTATNRGIKCVKRSSSC